MSVCLPGETQPEEFVKDAEPQGICTYPAASLGPGRTTLPTALPCTAAASREPEITVRRRADFMADIAATFFLLPHLLSLYTLGRRNSGSCAF